MLQSHFEACIRSLNVEQGRKFSCMWLLPIVKPIIFSSVNNILVPNGIQERHSSYDQSTLTTSRIGI